MNLRLSVRGINPAYGVGERASRDKGAGVEFADHRAYQPGDDLRHLDVAVYFRLREPVVRQYHPQRQLDVTIIVDASASMSFGYPDKASYAKRVAAGLACCVLAGSDRLRLGVVRDGTLELSRRVTGMRRIDELLAWLDARDATGTADLDKTLRSALPELPVHGVVVLLSDFLSDSPAAGVATVASHGPTLLAIQVLAPTEVSPELPEGNLRLVDCETGSSLGVAWRTDVAEAYRLELEHLRGQLRAVVERVGGQFIAIETDMAVRDVLLGQLVQKGLLQ